MKATAGPLPAGDDWRFEVKWDGMRLIVVIDDGVVSLWSGNGRNVTVSYPELAALGAATGLTSATLDGEVVVFDAQGRPDFGALQHRMHVANPRHAAERAAEYPAVLCLFDVLALDGHDVSGLPWESRRGLLEQLVEPGPHWQVPATHADGVALLAAADAQGLEGLIAKRVTSAYQPGGRTKDWVKVKIRRRQEFVVGGWGAGTGGRSGRIGGLLVGYHDTVGEPLRWAGRVGSGLSDAEIEVLTGLLVTSDTCPFDPVPDILRGDTVTWVEPTVVVEVEFAEWSADRRLRHPVYAGRRNDVDPESVTAAP